MNAPLPMALRIARLVDATGDCWVWLGDSWDGRYGRMKIGPNRARRSVAAHRASYEAFVGPIPDGLTLDHLCRNTKCVNPEHLEPVTMRENTLRGTNFVADNARKTHCPLGHEYTYTTKRGKRRCNTCGRLEGARNRARAKLAGGEIPPHLERKR